MGKMPMYPRSTDDVASFLWNSFLPLLGAFQDLEVPSGSVPLSDVQTLKEKRISNSKDSCLEPHIFHFNSLALSWLHSWLHSFFNSFPTPLFPFVLIFSLSQLLRRPRWAFSKMALVLCALSTIMVSRSNFTHLAIYHRWKGLPPFNFLASSSNLAKEFGVGPKTFCKNLLGLNSRSKRR